MTAESKGRDLFIVDNSISGWTGLKYLEEWTDITKSFDIATGFLSKLIHEIMKTNLSEQN